MVPKRNDYQEYTGLLMRDWDGSDDQRAATGAKKGPGRCSRLTFILDDNGTLW